MQSCDLGSVSPGRHGIELTGGAESSPRFPGPRRRDWHRERLGGPTRDYWAGQQNSRKVWNIVLCLLCGPWCLPTPPPPPMTQEPSVSVLLGGLCQGGGSKGMGWGVKFTAESAASQQQGRTGSHKGEGSGPKPGLQGASTEVSERSLDCHWTWSNGVISLSL